MILKMWFKKFFIITLLSFISSISSSPNIVIFLADDLGRNDVGYHGSAQISTPNTDAIAYNGAVLNKHYTMHVCTPSRTALLTGNHPIRSGMQGAPISAGEPRALPLNMPTLAERLLELGYSTHLVGKWHLGHENRSVTPTARGFQTHLGYWNGFVGYFDYEIRETLYNGFDLHEGFKPAFEHKFKYATDLFTDRANNLIKNHNTSNPLFLLMSHLAAHAGKDGVLLETPTPLSATLKYSHIGNLQRRLYADIVNRLDSSIGTVVQALKDKGILEDTILLFMSDNGAQTIGMYQNYGSNWPFRGLKFTLFEGGVRNAAAIWSKSLKNKHYIENTPIHIVDWLPTLYAAAGGNVADLGQIDGINHWPLLTENIVNPTPRRDILLNINESNNQSAILSSDGRYKLTQGTYLFGVYDGYYGDSGRTSKDPKYNITSVLNSDVNKAILSVDSSLPLTEEIINNMRSKLEIQQADADRNTLSCSKESCLFDLAVDPTETTDISEREPEILDALIKSLDSYRAELVPQTNKMVDPFSSPVFCYGSWFPWKETENACQL